MNIEPQCAVSTRAVPSLPSVSPSYSSCLRVDRFTSSSQVEDEGKNEEESAMEKKTSPKREVEKTPDRSSHSLLPPRMLLRPAIRYLPSNLRMASTSSYVYSTTALSPPVHRGMAVLDRKLFEVEMKVMAARIPAALTTQFARKQASQ